VVVDMWCRRNTLSTNVPAEESKSFFGSVGHYELSKCTKEVREFWLEFAQ
jgi:hypothetical protein